MLIRLNRPFYYKRILLQWFLFGEPKESNEMEAEQTKREKMGKVNGK